MIGLLKKRFAHYVEEGKKVPLDVLAFLSNVDEPSVIADTIALHLSLALPKKQALLEALNVCIRLELLVGMLDEEIELMAMEGKINQRILDQMDNRKRRVYLDEQIKAIQHEIGSSWTPSMRMRVKSLGG